MFRAVAPVIPARVQSVPLAIQKRSSRSSTSSLLLGRLGLNESHVCPGNCFADCLGVGGIVLVSLHVRLDIGWRHQTHCMTKCLEFSRPMMRRCAGLDTDKTRRQLLEESSDVTPLQLAPDDRIAFRVNAMDLKNRLRDVETNRR